MQEAAGDTGSAILNLTPQQPTGMYLPSLAPLWLPLVGTDSLRLAEAQGTSYFGTGRCLQVVFGPSFLHRAAGSPSQEAGHGTSRRRWSTTWRCYLQPPFPRQRAPPRSLLPMVSWAVASVSSPHPAPGPCQNRGRQPSHVGGQGLRKRGGRFLQRKEIITGHGFLPIAISSWGSFLPPSLLLSRNGK